MAEKKIRALLTDEEMKAMDLVEKAIGKSRQWGRVLKNLDGRGDRRFDPAVKNAIALADELVKDKSKPDRKKVTLIMTGVDNDLKDLKPRFSRPRRRGRTGL